VVALSTVVEWSVRERPKGCSAEAMQRRKPPHGTHAPWPSVTYGQRGLSSPYNSHSWAMHLTAARCGRSPIFIARPLMCCGLARLRFARHVCGQHASARIYLHAAISREQDVRFAMALRKPDHVCVQITSISYSSSSYKSAGDLRSAQRTR
jgi:hypothetical protein